MRGTAREEPSAQCSKQETQKNSFNHHLLPLPRPQNKDGNCILNRPCAATRPAKLQTKAARAQTRNIFARV